MTSPKEQFIDAGREQRQAQALERQQEQLVAEVETRFSYHPPQPGQPERYTRLREEAKRFAVLVHELTPASREQALALTKIEEAVMWANAAIARREKSPPPAAASAAVG